MAQNPLLRRYLDAGMQFTQMTQQRAEAIVKDLVKAGEVQAEQAQAVVSDLVDRSRKNSERLIDQVRREIRSQISNLGLATQDDIARLERKIDRKTAAARPAPRKTAPPKKATPAKKAAPARRAPATKKR